MTRSYWQGPHTGASQLTEAVVVFRPSLRPVTPERLGAKTMQGRDSRLLQGELRAGPRVRLGNPERADCRAGLWEWA